MVRRDAPLEQIFLDACQRGVVEADLILIAAILHRLNVALGRRAHVNNLPVLVRVEPTILELNVAQKHDYDFLAEILGLSHLGQTFRRFKRIGGGEQQDRLATRIGFPQSVFPALACSDVFQIEENLLLRPVVRTEPLFECNGRNVVFARMTDEEPGQG